MFAKLFDTLSYRITKLEKEWRAQNDTMQEYEYGVLQRQFILLAEKPAKHSLGLLLIFISASVVAFSLPSEIYPTLPEGNNPEVLSSYFSALWSVQSTIAAMIYPIVIAFVTILIQRHHNARTILGIYLHDSAAVLSGLSALALILLMGVQYVFVLQLEQVHLAAWLGLDCVYFLLNVIFSGYFLYRTFNFLVPVQRADSIRRYSFNVIWPRERKAHLANMIWTLWARELSSRRTSRKDSRPEVTFGGIGVGLSNGIKVTREIRKGFRLSSVRFRPLEWVVTRWKQRASEVDISSDHEEQFFGIGPDRMRLSVPLHMGVPVSGEVTLCVSSPQVPLTRLESFVLRRSLVFSRSKVRGNLSCTDTLEDLKADVLIALAHKEIEFYRSSLREFVEFCSALILINSFHRSDGRIDNYGLLPSETLFFGRRVVEIWLDVLIDLFEPSANAINENSSYIEQLVFQPCRILSDVSGSASVDTQIHVIRLFRPLMYRIESWWSTTVERQGLSIHNSCNPALLSFPNRHTYQSILRAFVGEWESIARRFPSTRERAPEWVELQDSARLHEVHLIDTGSMLARAIQRGDEDCAQILLDILLKWFSSRDFADSRYHLVSDGDTFDFEVISKPWPEVVKGLDTRYIEELELRTGLAAIALYNYWKDVCLALSYMLVSWSRECPARDSFPIRVVRALVQGQSPVSDGHSVRTDKPIESATDLLASTIRQYYGGNDKESRYRNRLDSFVSSISRLNEAPMVHGRVYTFMGEDGLNSFFDGPLLLLTRFVVSGWNPTNDILPMLNRLRDTNFEYLAGLSSKLASWKERLSSPGFDTYRPIFDALKISGSTKTFATARNDAVAGLDLVTNEIERLSREAITNAVVSDSRLRDVVDWACSECFSAESGPVPISLFAEVLRTPNTLSQHKIPFIAMEKGPFTSIEMANRAVNDNEKYAKVTRSYVGAAILGELLEKSDYSERIVNDSTECWKIMDQFGEEAVANGLKPLLIINRNGGPIWFAKWLETSKRMGKANPVLIAADPNNRAGYRGTVCEFDVYHTGSLRNDLALLTTIETFRSISFTTYEQDLPLSIDWTIPDEDATKIDVILSFSFKIDLEKGPCILLKCGDATDF